MGDTGFDLETMVSVCPVAYNLYKAHGCDDVLSAFNIANHLHLHGFLKEAAAFYQRALILRLADPEGHPRPELLLQVKLLCLIKAQEKVDEEELNFLKKLSVPLYNYILGVMEYYRNNITAIEALKIIGNSFEEFHTGEEIDAINMKLIYECLEKGVFPNKIRKKTIPRQMFFYWDQNIPQDVSENIDHHKEFKSFKVELFDKVKAADWLHQYYGRDAQSIFLKARHPAEAADILRVHVIYLYGGFWVDADLKVTSEEVFNQNIPLNYSEVFMLTDGYFVHNDFFGCAAQSTILEDCLLSIYRNCYNYEGLFISYKTGPGVFMRALNRTYYRCLDGISKDFPFTKILNQAVFDKVTQQYPVSYKQFGTWTAA